MALQDSMRLLEETTPQAASAMRDAMSADEVAAFLSVDRKTVYAAVVRNDIPHRRLGKRILFSRAALALWLRGTCKGSSESALR
jgi:excisionase family DNA binding protein